MSASSRQPEPRNFLPPAPAVERTAAPSADLRRPVGRPAATINLDRVRELSALGLNIDQIAHRLGVGERTLYDHFTRDDCVRRAFDEGRAEATEIIARRLQQMGLDENNLGALIFWLKTKGGFNSPKEPAVMVVPQVPNAPIVIDGTHVRQLADQQRKYLNGDMDWD